jgi:hypothetical protein|tara:strand:+ start:273 stop:749 length:477 start_codon:yes stop_codon:yes gene_type:complete
MDKEECMRATQLLSVSWNMPLDQSSINIRTMGYWEYLQDLPYDEVKTTIKSLALSGKRWAPRPAELRINTLAKIRGDELPPEPEEAWTVLQAIGQKIYSGTYDYDKPHPVLADTMRRLGSSATSLTTNSDRAMFTSLYEKVREEYILNNYGGASDETN